MEADTFGNLLAALRAIGVAVGLAALLGLERELARKPAGLRTHMLVGLAAALLVRLGNVYVERFAAEFGGVVRADPIRVIEAIVVGISFLGAGTIVRDRGERVEGLTTAASVLVTAAIAIAAALDRQALAATVALATVAILMLVGWLEKRLVARDAGQEGVASGRPSRDTTPPERA